MAVHLTHVARPSRDIEATIEFYRELVGLHVVHDREDDGVRVVWMGEKKRANEFVLVFIAASPETRPAPHFADHLGYELASRAEVDSIAERARLLDVLSIPATDGGEIVGYYCMVEDPDGNLVEFSFGQSIEVADEADTDRNAP